MEDQSPERGPAYAVLTGVTYGVLLVLGAILGVVAGFEHDWYLGPFVPLASLLWIVVLFAVPYGMSRLMNGKLGAVVPAVGWVIVSVLSSGERPEGDLVVSGDPAGYLYLYGGMIAVALAVVLAPSTGSWLLTPRPGARSDSV